MGLFQDPCQSIELVLKGLLELVIAIMATKGFSSIS